MLRKLFRALALKQVANNTTSVAVLVILLAWSVTAHAIAGECTDPATAQHTRDLVIYDASNRVLAVVCPSTDSELSDPAFAPPPGGGVVTVAHTNKADPVTTARQMNSKLVDPAQAQAAAQAEMSAASLDYIAVRP